MTQMIVLPHVELCPEGTVIEAEPGKTICQALLRTASPSSMPARCPVPARPAM